MSNKTNLVYLNGNIFRRRVFLYSVNRRGGEKKENRDNAVGFCSTHSLPILPRPWTRLRLYRGPTGIWRINLPPEAMAPPVGPPVTLLWPTEKLLLVLGPSIFLFGAVDELLLSADCAISSTINTSH